MKTEYKTSPNIRAAYKRYRDKNIEKCRERERLWRVHNREKIAAYTRVYDRKSYGISNPSSETRGGHCEICGEYKKKLHYDHDKKTGLHRGWLCVSCNTKLEWHIKNRDEIEEYLRPESRYLS